MYFTLEQIDRGIFEALRLRLVQLGYMPDIVIANTKELYNNALQGIRTTGKQPVALYGVGSWNAKLEKEFSTIAIERITRGESALGIQSSEYYEEDGTGKFNKKKTPVAEILTYTITIICEDAKNERVLQEIMTKTFGVKSFVKGRNTDRTETQNSFALYRRQVVNQSGEDFIEHIFNYQTNEVYLGQDEILETNIPRIETIFLETVLKTS